MKKIFPIIVLITTLIAQSCGELLQVAEGMAQAAGAAYFEQTAERYGYSREDASSMTTFLADGIFGNTENANKGIAYVTANDKYLQQQIIANEVFDMTGTLTGEQQLMNTFKSMTSAQLSYKSETSNATTDAERQAAFDKRSKNWANVTFDAYTASQEKKAHYLAERSSLAKALREQGYTNDQAVEIAGSMLAVQRSNYMTYEEKQEYLSAFLPNEPAETILATIQDIDSGNYVEQPVASPDDIAEQQAAEAQAKAKVEKENAIYSVTSALLNSYHFDSTELNDEQKETLDMIAVVLSQYSDLTIEIKGHTCDIGSNSVNERVGLRRAETAKSYLIEKGIAAERIITSTGGEKEPVVENSSSDNRKLNRRLTFVIK